MEMKNTKTRNTKVRNGESIGEKDVFLKNMTFIAEVQIAVLDRFIQWLDDRGEKRYDFCHRRLPWQLWPV